MVDRVWDWVEAGETVIIYTARLSHPDCDPRQIEYIHNWLALRGLPKLRVTCVKDYRVNEFWCDRAVSVETNTGRAFSWNNEVPDL